MRTNRNDRRKGQEAHKSCPGHHRSNLRLLRWSELNELWHQRLLRSTFIADETNLIVGYASVRNYRATHALISGRSVLPNHFLRPGHVWIRGLTMFDGMISVLFLLNRRVSLHLTLLFLLFLYLGERSKRTETRKKVPFTNARVFKLCIHIDHDTYY